MFKPTSFYEQQLIDYFNIQPSSVKGSANLVTESYKQYLYTLVFSAFKFNIPEEWELNYFRYMLFVWGSVGVIYTNEYGWIISPYSVAKLNYQYQPKVITVINSILNLDKTGIIDVNCGIVRLFDNYVGVDGLVTQYATKLSNIDKAVDINLMNCNVSKAFSASDKKQAEEIKIAYEEATTGKPFIVLNKKVLNDDNRIVNLLGNVRNDYVSDMLMQTKREIINEFLTRIGIRNANYTKRERLNSQEVNENNDETKAMVSVMEENIDLCFNRINKISDLNLSVELRYDYEGV